MFIIFVLFNTIEHVLSLNKMVLIEREILNWALEALKEKFALPDNIVIHKEDGTYGNFDALV